MDYRSLVERKLTPQGQVGKDTVYACPKCEDISTGHHLYVDYDKGRWHCFHCGIGSKKMKALLRILNIDASYDYSKLYDERENLLDDIITPKKIIKKDAVEYSNDLGILTEYYNQHTTNILSDTACNYLSQRGITLELIEKLEMREGLNRYGDTITIRGKEFRGRDYSGRIMIPSLRSDDNISFYVGRDYIGNKGAKYLNCPKELGSASEDVWNLELVDSESVIICEGVFTAIAASPVKLNAVATYGKSIAHRADTDDGIRVTSQGEKLLNKKFKNYFICYDADAHSEAIATCNYLYDRGANVYLILIDPEKYGKKADVADIGYTEFLFLMGNAIHYEGSISIL